jgi:hypothetical protein
MFAWLNTRWNRRSLLGAATVAGAGVLAVGSVPRAGGGSAPAVDIAVEGIGDAAHMPADAKGS